MKRQKRFNTRRLYQLAILVFLILCLPVWLIRGCIAARQKAQQLPENSNLTAPVIRVFDKDSGKVVKMDVEEYLIGVVAAEMPASFDEEALKAQAVAARTYTVRKLKQYDGDGCKSHKNADICTDSTCCQAYNSSAERKTKWSNPTYEKRVREAVLSTQGELVVYNEEPIEAFFHSTAGGYTEDSENAFSAAVPYLRSVKSDETTASHYENTKTFSRTAFASSINNAFKSAKLKAATLEKTVEVLSRFESGRVDQLRLGGVTTTGKELRKLLSLDSTNITFEFNKKSVVIKTKGYGHGVGMSQTGADAMAKKGSNYKEILEYYYVGTNIEKKW